MRAREFVFEQEIDKGSEVDNGIETLKTAISHKIKELPNDSSTEKALHEIEDLLGSVGAGTKMGVINNQLAQLNDASVTQAQKMLARYIYSIDMSRAERDDLFSKWKSDTLINRELLTSPGVEYSITDLVNGYDTNPAIKELTNDLMEVSSLGQGKGEFMLSVMSRSITKQTKGDLKVDNKTVEVKTKHAGAARLTDREVRPAPGYEKAVENFKNTFADQIKQFKDPVPTTGLRLDVFIGVGQVIDSTSPLYKKYKSSVSEIINLIFHNVDNTALINSILIGDIAQAKKEYGISSLNFYRSVKTHDDGILMIDMTTSPMKFLYFTNYDDIKSAGKKLKISTAYPITSVYANAYPQMSIV